MTSADWPNTTIVSGDITEQLAVLRNEGDGEILVHGGVSFVQELARLDLADEYRMTVFPYVAGTGKRLFTDATKSRQLELASSTEFTNGIVAMVYRRHR